MTAVLTAASLAAWASVAAAEVSIETSVNRSRLAVGDELLLDIIVTGAQGRIAKPQFPPIDGFTSYSQGSSQEISIVNGVTSMRSVFNFVLIANSTGRKRIGPFDLEVGGRVYKVAAVEVEVTDTPASVPAGALPAVSSPAPRPAPARDISSEDIYVKAWLDKSEAFVGEPVVLTYTVYTRLPATYKGFEKEPEITGFWIEEFPPDRNAPKTDKILNGSRYVVADVRRLALFGTEPGVFTIDPGVLSSTVEVRDQQAFNTFFSSNIFGRRTVVQPSMLTHVFSKPLPTEKVTLTVKALPTQGRPASFNGAVGEYAIESSLDKAAAEEGEAVTYKVRIYGQGNLNTVEPPALPELDHFKIYDSSSATNISKDRRVVEGQKVTETVLVPKKAGAYTIPALDFSFFDPRTRTFKQLQTKAHPLGVRPGRPEAPASGAPPQPSQTAPAQSAPRQLDKDIRYVKMHDPGPRPIDGRVAGSPWLAGYLAAVTLLGWFFAHLGRLRARASLDAKAQRIRRSSRVARERLRNASRMLKPGEQDRFYAELYKAVHGYFVHRLGLSGHFAEEPEIRAKLTELGVDAERLRDLSELLEEVSMGRFARVSRGQEEMKKALHHAERVITSFEKVRWPS